MDYTINTLKEQILIHQSQFPNAEVCGFIVFFDDKFEAIPTTNVSKDETLFMIDGADYLKAKIAYRVCGVYHTHVIADEQPSEFDLISAEHSCLPFLVYSSLTDKFSLTVPDYVDADLEGVSKLKERLND